MRVIGRLLWTSQFNVGSCGNVYIAARQLPFALHILVRRTYIGLLTMHRFLRKLTHLCNVVAISLKYARVKFSFVVSPPRRMASQVRCPDLGGHVDMR